MELNKSLFYAIIVGVIFFVVIMPLVEKCYNDEKNELVEKLENIMGSVKIDTNKCSRACCVNSGWELPADLKAKDMSPEEIKKYIPTNFSCNLGSNNGGGCVCVTKPDYDVLSARGSNGVNLCNN